MGWFNRKPEIKVGDTVWDSYYVSIGKPRRKVTVTRIEADGSFTFSLAYYVRTDFGYESAIPRKRSQLESAPEKPKEKPVAIDLRHQESDTFKVFAKKEYRTGFGNIPKDAAARAAKKFSDGYVVFYNGMQCHMPSSDFHDGFEDVGQRDMRIRIETKEEKDVGGELYGYPPEEKGTKEQWAALARERVAKAEREKAQARMEAETSRKEAEELRQKYEVVRREKVAEEYGIVAERHLWSIVVNVPQRWGGKLIERHNEQKSEVLTEGRNMVEAAMAAEAMAKGIAEDAHVLSIDFVRVIGALK